MHTRLARRASAARTRARGAASAAAVRRWSTWLSRAIRAQGPTPFADATRRRTVRTPVATVVSLLLPVLLWACLATLPQLALAQTDPSVALNTNLMRAGDTVALDASNLKASTDYTVTLSAPDGSSQQSTVKTDPSGKLHFAHPLDQVGTWTVRLSGPGINAPLMVQVTPAQSSPQGTPNGGAGNAPGVGTPGAGTPGAGTPTQPPAGNGQPTSPAQPGVPLQLAIEQGSLVATRGGQVQWRLDFPAASGETAGALLNGGQAYVGHGNSLLVLDPESGHVTARYALPAQVVGVTAQGAGVRVTVQYQEGAQQGLDVTDAGVSGAVRFDTDPAMFAWLRNEAKVSDPTARLAQDPTNPWLYVAAARQASDAQAATNDYRQALAHAVTFYDRAQLARVLYAADEPDLAKQAIDGALRDYVQRGYAAELLTDPTLREAYGFPQGALDQAVTSGNLQAAAFWAPWAYRMSTPAVPSTQAALLAYSRALRQAGQKNQADLWRSRAHEGGGFHLDRGLRRAALALGRAGWYSVVALLVAMLFLHLTLIAKYWRPQSLALKQRRESGRTTGRVPRLFALRYYSITEKFVLVVMFAAVLALASLSAWARRGDQLPAAWHAGTLASVPARDAMSGTLASSAVADYVRGYAEQVAGDEQSADQAYTAAGDFGPALNNLGALRKDDALYQKANEVGPNVPAALFNLGRTTDPSRLHAAYAAGAPLLAVPNDTLLRSAVAGSFQQSLAEAYTNPWAGLTAFNPLAIPKWLWDVLVVLFLAWAAVTVIALLVPRPGLARNAPRTGVYHLLALLIPGSGLSDELWGVLLLVPWAIFGLDLVLHFLPLAEPAGISLTTDYVVLSLIYVLNFVSFFVELASYRRRMADLKRSHPDTARAYGLDVGWEPENWPE